MVLALVRDPQIFRQESDVEGLRDLCSANLKIGHGSYVTRMATQSRSQGAKEQDTRKDAAINWRGL